MSAPGGRADVIGTKADIIHKPPDIHAVDDGFQAVRALLARSWFDKTKCDRGLSALRAYRREWDEKMAVFRPRPLHDWSSHAADAARTAAMGLDESPPIDMSKINPLGGRRGGAYQGSHGWMGA